MRRGERGLNQHREKEEETDEDFRQTQAQDEDLDEEEERNILIRCLILGIGLFLNRGWGCDKKLIEKETRSKTQGPQTRGKSHLGVKYLHEIHFNYVGN